MKLATEWVDVLISPILIIFTAPYRRTFKLYTWEPLKRIREAENDRKVFISRVREWKEEKYKELESVQLASSFCVGVTLSVISWTKMPKPLWFPEALLFCSLICSIWAVITSIQTRSILNDLPNSDKLTEDLIQYDYNRLRRVILRYEKTPGVSHWLMVFLWQFPSMTMSYAWCSFLSGLTLYVCTPFIRQEEWNNHMKIAIVYLSVGSIGLFSYMLSWAFVLLGEQDYERSPSWTGLQASEHPYLWHPLPRFRPATT